MNTTTKWVLGGVAALTAAGLMYAAPVLAAGGYGIMGGAGQAGMMSGAGGYGARSGQAAGMMQGVQGNPAGMHNSMAPLMSVMPKIHTQVMGDVAGRLGLTPDDLFKAMADGKSLAQIAADKNVAVGDVQAIMTGSMKTALDQLVEAKQLTAEQAGRMRGYMEQNLTSRPNGTGGGMNGTGGSMMGEFVPSGTAQ